MYNKITYNYTLCIFTYNMDNSNQQLLSCAISEKKCSEVLFDDEGAADIKHPEQMLHNEAIDCVDGAEQLLLK